MRLPEDTYLLARRGWCGMRDAGQAFEFAVRDHFLDHDLNTGCSVHASSPIVTNYFGLGVRSDLEGYKAKLSERFIFKDRGILGADGLHELRIFKQSHHVSSSETWGSRDVDVRSGSEARWSVHGCIWTQCVEEGQANSLGRSKLVGSTFFGSTFLGWEATCRVPQQLHEMFVFGLRSTWHPVYSQGDLASHGITNCSRRWNTQGSFTISGESSTCAVAIPTAGMHEKSLGIDRFELGSSSGEGVVFQTWCRKNSTHPLSTRRAGKDLAPDVKTKSGILEDT